MSTPRSIALPDGVRRVRFEDPDVAALATSGDGRGTIVCAPGFTGSKEDFLALMPELTSYGWSVVAFDHRGQFESGRRPDYSLDGWADDVCRLAGHLPGPVHLVGHSLGGLIAGRAAPRRDWESVTLLNSGSGPIHQSQHDRLRLLIHALDQLTMEQIWQAKTASDRASGVPANEPEIEEFLQRRFLSTDPRSLSTMAQILLDGPQQNLAGTTAQLLIAFGTEDPDSWSWQTQVDLAQRWRTRLATIPGAAHSPAVEAPEATAALLAGTFTRAGDPRCVKSPGYGYAPGMRIMTPLDRDPASVRRARKTVGDQLCAWGLEAIVDDAELVTSELVTNAISHGGGFVELRIAVLPDRVRISVLDGERAGIPEVSGDRGLEIGGRGLSLVEHVATEWGYDITDDGKEVWAELAI